MATGDDAIAAGMADVNGATTPANTLDTEIMLTRDYIAQGKGAVSPPTANKVVKRDAAGRAQFASPSASADAATKGYVDTKVGTLGAVATENVVPVSKGGTGSTTAAAARTALGAVQNDGAGALRFGAIGGNRVRVANTGYVTDNTLAYLGDLDGRVAKSGDTMTGHLWLPAASPADSSYTIAYINGDGRVSRGASTERVKKFISDIDPLGLGNLFQPFKRWQMRNGDGVWRYGYTAEQLAADPATEPFVIYERAVETDDEGNVTGAPHLARDAEGNPVPLSIDFIGLLLAQVAQLNSRIEALEAG